MGLAPLNHIDPLNIFQEKCVRTITFSEYLAPSEPIFQILNVLNFENLVIAYVYIFTWRCINLRVTTI